MTDNSAGDYGTEEVWAIMAPVKGRIRLGMAFGALSGLATLATMICLAMVVLALGLLLWLDWRLALAVLVVLALGIAAMRGAQARRRAMALHYNDARENVSAPIVEFVQAMPVVRNFDTGSDSFGRYQRALAAYREVLARWYRESGNSVRLTWAILSPLPTLAAVLWLGLIWVGGGDLDPVRWLAVLLLCTGMAEAVMPMMMLRHADPAQGQVLIGGADLRQIPEAELRRSLSVVFQDVHLFNDSVMANIRMARPKATDAEIHAAARAAQCLDFIERLPQGWDTPLGDIGERLSGGERQRISIARALLKDAPIVILDEPTAALDTESERAVQRAIDALARDRTVIVIAHRLSTIMAARQIAVIDEGRVVQRGNHADLLAQPGRYRDMWQAQQSAKLWFDGGHAGDPVRAGHVACLTGSE